MRAVSYCFVLPTLDPFCILYVNVPECNGNNAKDCNNMINSIKYVLSEVFKLVLYQRRSKKCETINDKDENKYTHMQLLRRERGS